MANCPTCGAPRPAGDARCVRCGALPITAQDVDDETSDEFGSRTDELVITDEFRTLLEFDEQRSPRSAAPTPAGSLDDPIRLTVRPRLEYASLPGQSEPVANLLVDVSAEGPPQLDPEKGPVAHVILLLDVSASMNHDDKFPVLTQALRGMLEELSAPGAAPVLLSVIVFAYGAKTLFRDVLASTLDPDAVFAKIKASPLLFTRYTDVPGAMKRAGKIAIAQLRANRAMPVRIYVMTDGKPQDLVRTRYIMDRISNLPVDVDGLGFGADADVGLLQEFVSGGRGGTVKHVRPETIGDAFDRIGVVAQRVVSSRALLDLELAPGVIGLAAHRYRPGRHRYRNDAFVDGARFRTDLGTLESGRTYSLLFELRLPETNEAVTEVGKVTLRIQGQDGFQVAEAPVSVARTAGDALPEPDADVAAARDVLASVSGSDEKTQLRALKVRRKLYIAERRDPHLVAVIDKAISALEAAGSLDALSSEERATLRSHTVTAGTRPPADRKDRAAG